MGDRKKPTLGDQHEISNYRIRDTLHLVRTGLSPGTKYNVRTYAKTSDGSVYGNIVSFTTRPATVSKTFNPALTYGSVTDIDGNSYKTIAIGTQEWMAENLKTTRFNDGALIPLVTDNVAWDNLKTPGYCWFENDEAVFRNIYGGYYNWYSVFTERLCPTGWHVPSEEDWKVLKMTLGMTEEQATSTYGPSGTTEGDKLKETGTINWMEGSTAATNESGFTALPGGTRIDIDAKFFGEGSGAGWWSSDPFMDYGMAWSHHLTYNSSLIYRSDMLFKVNGLNIRCIKDK